MYKRFCNYQLLLSGSLGFSNAEKHTRPPFFSILISILFMCALSLVLGNGVIFYPITFTMFMVYSIINSRNKLFEIVPVSKMYSLINI